MYSLIVSLLCGYVDFFGVFLKTNSKKNYNKKTCYGISQYVWVCVWSVKWQDKMYLLM